MTVIHLLMGLANARTNKVEMNTFISYWSRERANQHVEMNE
jgi:hypothetical protein